MYHIYTGNFWKSPKSSSWSRRIKENLSLALLNIRIVVSLCILFGTITFASIHLWTIHWSPVYVPTVYVYIHFNLLLLAHTKVCVRKVLQFLHGQFTVLIQFHNHCFALVWHKNVCIHLRNQSLTCVCPSNIRDMLRSMRRVRFLKFHWYINVLLCK